MAEAVVVVVVWWRPGANNCIGGQGGMCDAGGEGGGEVRRNWVVWVWGMKGVWV
jgi:hypothetical protein